MYSASTAAIAIHGAGVQAEDSDLYITEPFT
jgi:hypothetical protein